MSERLVAAFRGSVRCRPKAGAVQWCLEGVDRDDGGALEVLLSGAAALRLPARLVAAELYVRDEAVSPVWELRSAGQVLPLPVRALQIHRRADAAFAAALPRFAVPRTTRAGWFVLLNLLRVPGLARLLQVVRDRSGAHGNE
jgi:hypothetical protein